MAHDALQEQQVDVAARQHDHDALAGDVAERSGHQRGNARRSRALDDELLALVEQRHRRGDLLVVDRDHALHMLLDDREGELARPLDGDAVGDRAGRLGCPDRTCLERVDEGGAGLGLHADDRGAGPQPVHGEGDAGDQPAAAARHHDEIGVRERRDDLESGRALPGDDVLVIEGRDEDRTLALGNPARVGQSLVERAALQLDPRPVAACRLDLRERGVDGHADRARHAEGLCGEGHALRVVAGAGRDHAACALF